MNIQPRHTERRDAERIPFSSRVAIKTDKAIYFMETKNIARGGAYIESEIQVPIGTTCNLVPFMDECANIFEAEGTIIRSTKLGTRYGMGIRFDRIPEGDIDSLQEIVVAAQQNEKVTALA